MNDLIKKCYQVFTYSKNQDCPLGTRKKFGVIGNNVVIGVGVIVLGEVYIANTLLIGCQYSRK